MNELQISAQLKIHTGKLDEFKKLAKKCMKIVREKDKGTLQYDWFLSADQTTCDVRERYKDSNSVLEHIGNLGDSFGEMLAIADMSLKVYGLPSPELLTAARGMEVEIYSPFQSI